MPVCTQAFVCVLLKFKLTVFHGYIRFPVHNQIFDYLKMPLTFLNQDPGKVHALHLVLCVCVCLNFIQAIAPFPFVF